MKPFLPFTRPSIDEDCIAAVAQVFRSGQLASGPKVQAFESALTAYLGDARPEVTKAADVPWVAEPHGTASRHFAEQACRQAGFDPDVRYETADLQVHVALIASGNAVALVPGLMWQGRPHPSVRLIDPPAAPPPTARRWSRSARPCRRQRADSRATTKKSKSVISNGPWFHPAKHRDPDNGERDP